MAGSIGAEPRGVERVLQVQQPCHQPGRQRKAATARVESRRRRSNSMHRWKLLADGRTLGQGREIDHQINHFWAVVAGSFAHDASVYAMRDLPLQGVDRVLLGLEFDRVLFDFELGEVGGCANQARQMGAGWSGALGDAAVSVACDAAHQMATESARRHPDLIGAEAVLRENLGTILDRLRH